MKICGIELKSNNAILSVIEIIDVIIEYKDIKEKKIVLEDDEDLDGVARFSNSIKEFILDNKIELIAIKKRSKKGNFAGGAVTFKMEGIIQLNNICDVKLVSAQTINSYQKKNNIEFPKVLNKYQEQSYLTALCAV